MKGKKFIRACANKWRKIGSNVVPCTACEHCCQWGLWSASHEDCFIPRDVPKGHLVVYVGENYRRFVIKINVLYHPLFKALLDQAKDEFDFTSNSKLCIPCDVSLFLSVVRRAGSANNRQVPLCL